LIAEIGDKCGKCVRDWLVGDQGCGCAMVLTKMKFLVINRRGKMQDFNANSIVDMIILNKIELKQAIFIISRFYYHIFQISGP
jgi:hypothetical protein